VLTGLAVAGALIAAVFIESRPRVAEVEPVGEEQIVEVKQAA
jgi:hypothetical protein